MFQLINSRRGTSISIPTMLVFLCVLHPFLFISAPPAPTQPRFGCNFSFRNRIANRQWHHLSTHNGSRFVVFRLQRGISRERLGLYAFFSEHGWTCRVHLRRRLRVCHSQGWRNARRGACLGTHFSCFGSHDTLGKHHGRVLRGVVRDAIRFGFDHQHEGVAPNQALRPDVRIGNPDVHRVRADSFRIHTLNCGGCKRRTRREDDGRR